MTDKGREATAPSRWRPSTEEWTAYSWQVFHLHVAGLAVVILVLTRTLQL
jgi:hypothetical protein